MCARTDVISMRTAANQFGDVIAANYRVIWRRRATMLYYIISSRRPVRRRRRSTLAE